MDNKKLYRFLFQPLAASFLSSAAFFAVLLGFFRPGYAVSDDIVMISLVSGYFGGKPLPFMIYSNVLLGFLLDPLYALNPTINWEIYLFLLVNFLSVVALVYVILSHLKTARVKIFAITALFLCDAFFVLNITFTMIAAFATIAGLCLLLTAVQSSADLKISGLVTSIALVLAGSLIRIESMLSTVVLFLPALLLLYRSLKFKKLVITFSILGLLVLAGYLFNSLYVQSHPDWYSFQLYDSARSQLHDTPRKNNADRAYPEIGWSKNDVKLFFMWFFPDRQIYSIGNLQYLAGKISDKQVSKSNIIHTLWHRLFSSEAIPYILLILSTWLISSIYGHTKKTRLPLMTLFATFLALDLFISWTMKNPDRVFIPLLAGTALFGLEILVLSVPNEPEISDKSRDGLKIRIFGVMGILAITAAFGVVLYNAIETTTTNIAKQTAYQLLLTDLKSLQNAGKINPDSLILSPEYGFPLDWANPFTVNLPNIKALEMGWLTFSPAYEKVLGDFGAQQLPEAFYQKKNIYLMTSPASLSAILDFIKEHKGLNVDAQTIYRIPGTDTELYQLRQKRN